MTDYEQVHIDQRGEVTLVRVRESRLTDFVQIEELGAELYRLVDVDRRGKLVLDLSDVEYLSSAALGKLISLNGRLKSRNGNLRLCGLQPQVLCVFTTCKLERLFDIKKDLAQATASF